MVKDLEKIGMAAQAVQNELVGGYTTYFSRKMWEFVNRHKYGQPFELTNIPNNFKYLGQLFGNFVDKYQD